MAAQSISGQGYMTSLLADLARAQSATVTRVWQIQTVDGTPGGGVYSSLAFTPAGRPAISHWNSASSDLEYAEYDGSNWGLQTVESEGSVGYCTSLAFTPSGRPAISYCASPDGGLKYAECVAVLIGP